MRPLGYVVGDLLVTITVVFAVAWWMAGRPTSISLWPAYASPSPIDRCELIPHARGCPHTTKPQPVAAEPISKCCFEKCPIEWGKP
jgi:hypothetical protein